MRVRRGVWIAAPLTAALVAGLLWLGQSAWVGRGLEAALETLLRREVVVEGARLDFLTFQARIERLRIARRGDPDRWAFEGGPAVLDLAFWPLWEGRWVVQDLRLTGIRGDTPRSAPAAAGPPTPARAETAEGPDLGERLRAALPRLDLAPLARRLDVDSLLSERPLATLAWADEQAQRWRRRVDEWQARLDEMAQVETELAELRARIDRLDLDTRDPARLRRQLKALEDIRDQARALRDRLRQTRRDLERDLDFSWDRVGLEAAREQDMALLQRIAGLDLAEVADALFGAPVVERLGPLLAGLIQARALLSGDDAEPPPPPPRRAGRDFVFPADPPPPPPFLLVSGRLQGEWPGRGPFDLRLRQLASHPAAWSRPLSWDLALGRDHPWRLTGRMDHRHGRDEDRLQLRGEGLDLGRVALAVPQDQPWPRAVTLGAARVEGALQQAGGRLQGSVQLTADQVRFHMPPREALAPAYAPYYDDLRRVFQQARSRFVLKVALAGTVHAPRLTLSSSLDQDLGRRLEALLGERLKTARRALRTHLDEAVAARLRPLQEALGTRRERLLARVDGWQKLEADLQARLDERRRRWETVLQERLDAAKEKAERRIEKALQKGLRDLGL